MADERPKRRTIHRLRAGSAVLIFAAGLVALAAPTRGARQQARAGFAEPPATHAGASENEPASLTLGAGALTSRLSPGSSLMVVLPDTQHYSARHPETFAAQTAWIARQAATREIEMVVSLGDLVDDNSPRQWDVAAAALGRLSQARLPIVVVPGNHDLGAGGQADDRHTGLNAALGALPGVHPPLRQGGHFEPGCLENTYRLFSMAGHDFILLALEWAPRDRVVAWANRVMSAHPDRLGILVTHAYMADGGWRFGQPGAPPQPYHPAKYLTGRRDHGGNDGEALWHKLVRRHRFVIVLSGHELFSGAARATHVTLRGTPCHQMLSNYQMRAEGGQGFLRLLEFLADGRTVNVHTYSPVLDEVLDDPAHHFTFDLPPPREARRGALARLRSGSAHGQ